MSVVSIKRKSSTKGVWGEILFAENYSAFDGYAQVLRRPGKHSIVCFDGYLSVDLNKVEDGKNMKRFGATRCISTSKN